jgi:alpha-tubulin suppressor-like RCC1 family protein
MTSRNLRSARFARFALLLPSLALPLAGVGLWACDGEFRNDCPEGTTQTAGGGDIKDACTSNDALAGTGGVAGGAGSAGGTGGGGMAGGLPPPLGACEAGQKQCSAGGLSECGPNGQWQAPAACEIGCNEAKGECVTPVQLAAGSTHACALLSDGTVRCWGDNGQGQLGGGPGPAVFRPQPVAGLTDVEQLKSSYDATCAISKTKDVYCWGANRSSMLTAEDKDKVDTPQMVAGNVLDVTLGSNHLCYATDQSVEGSLIRCRGQNYYAQAGNGLAGVDTEADTTDDLEKAFVDAQGVSGLPQAIAAGSDHTCALSQTGSSHCWGQNASGQTADPTTFSSGGVTKTAVSVPRDGLLQLAASAKATCAIETGGKVLCWGNNLANELGRGNLFLVRAVEPDYVVNLVEAEHLSAGSYHLCAVTKNGEVWCWGSASQAKLGKECSAPDIQCDSGETTGFPTRVALPQKATKLSTASASCALLVDHSVHCWGPNDYGQLGIGKVSAFESVPRRVVW